MQLAAIVAFEFPKARLSLGVHAPDLGWDSYIERLEVYDDFTIKQRIGRNELELSPPT